MAEEEEGREKLLPPLSPFFPSVSKLSLFVRPPLNPPRSR